MHLAFLVLRDFRNYEYLELLLEQGVSLFFGPNAAGKTNLLEACYYVSALTSPRAERDADLARWGHSAFAVAARVESDDAPSLIKVETRLTPSPRRRLSLNDAPAKRHELHAALPCVYFSPDDLYMVKRGSALRRRYLDVLISRANPSYSWELARYYESVERRNAALKRIRWDRSWQKALDTLDDLLVETGSTVLARRMGIMGRLAELVGETYAFIAGEGCRTSYVSTIGPLTEGASAQEIAPVFGKALGAVRTQETDRCVTLVGPHRDDVSIGFDEKSYRYFGSQGQQRSVALSLRIAEARVLEDAFGKKPVLLLDDVFSELDGERRDKVLSLCDLGHQILITSTDPVQDRREFNMFVVKDDAVAKYEP